MREGVLKALCLEVAKGDLAGERFQELWIESGVPLDGEEFEIMNQLIIQSEEKSNAILKNRRLVH